MSEPADSTHSLSSPSRFDVVVVSYNQCDRLLRCLASAAACVGTHLIVVDNDSADGSVEAARDAFPGADILALETNVGFGAAVNRGTRRGDAPYILLLNNDARLRTEALDRLAGALRDPAVAAAGPRLLGPAGEVEISADRTLGPWSHARYHVLRGFNRRRNGLIGRSVWRRYTRSRQVRSLSGACILLRREALEQVGGFDERFFLYAEDVDLCLRLRHGGWKLVYVGDAIVEHDRGASAATAPVATALHYRRSQIAFYRKHYGVLATSVLRLYLALRLTIKRFLARDKQQRRLAGDLLRAVLRESGD